MFLWQSKSFLQLSLQELYQSLQLRQRIFSIEQKCIYLDLDDYDQESMHIMCFEGSKLIAYARIIWPNLAEGREVIKFGRVCVDPAYRNQKLASQLLDKIFDEIKKSQFKDFSLLISAQQYLTQFYQRYGFVVCSGVYLDEGVPHVDMQREKLGAAPC